MKKLFIGSLAWATNDDSLKEFFSQFGEVSSASVVTDRESHRSRGFGFVEFANDEDADKAVTGADGKDLDGRQINVSVAQSAGPKEGGRREGGFRPRRDDNRGGGYRGGNGGGQRRSFGGDDNRGNSFRQRNW